jgi:catechol 2,3-dioxygenase-like lactoylglutathione lyase family enzyme
MRDHRRDVVGHDALELRGAPVGVAEPARRLLVPDQRVPADALAVRGRPADERIGDEYLWQLAENAWVVIDARPVQAARAGGAMMTLGVTDLDQILARLAAAGIAHEPPETYGNGVRHVVVTDPDGNELSLAQAPL